MANVPRHCCQLYTYKTPAITRYERVNPFEQNFVSFGWPISLCMQLLRTPKLPQRPGENTNKEYLSGANYRAQYIELKFLHLILFIHFSTCTPQVAIGPPVPDVFLQKHWSKWTPHHLPCFSFSSIDSISLVTKSEYLNPLLYTKKHQNTVSAHSTRQ